MKVILGLFLIVLGVVVGLYIGVWVCFVGGIIQIIQSVTPGPLNTAGVAIGILKVVCAGLAGWGSAILFMIPGGALLDK
jgi:hypothetical protein